jgi:hypothetical protein
MKYRLIKNTELVYKYLESDSAFFYFKRKLNKGFFITFKPKIQQSLRGAEFDY